MRDVAGEPFSHLDFHHRAVLSYDLQPQELRVTIQHDTVHFRVHKKIRKN